MSKRSSHGSIYGYLSGRDISSVCAAIAWMMTSCQLISAKSFSDHIHLSIFGDRRVMPILNCSEAKKEDARPFRNGLCGERGLQRHDPNRWGLPSSGV